MKIISDKFIEENINCKELIIKLKLAFRAKNSYCPPKLVCN